MCFDWGSLPNTPGPGNYLQRSYSPSGLDGLFWFNWIRVAVVAFWEGKKKPKQTNQLHFYSAVEIMLKYSVGWSSDFRGLTSTLNNIY